MQPMQTRSGTGPSASASQSLPCSKPALDASGFRLCIHNMRYFNCRSCRTAVGGYGFLESLTEKDSSSLVLGDGSGTLSTTSNITDPPLSIQTKTKSSFTVKKPATRVQDQAVSGSAIGSQTRSSQSTGPPPGGSAQITASVAIKMVPQKAVPPPPLPTVSRSSGKQIGEWGGGGGGVHVWYVRLTPLQGQVLQHLLGFLVAKAPRLLLLQAFLYVGRLIKQRRLLPPKQC